MEFLSHELCCKLPEGSDRRTVIAMLDRPMRVCGMVRNQGEPGGGPFWVRDERGVEQLQIAESSQIAPEDIGLMQSATHFNPVDLVCGVRRHDGTKISAATSIPRQDSYPRSRAAAATCALRSCRVCGTVPCRTGTRYSSTCP